MKACPACGRLYPVDAGFCPVDGSQLYSATQVPVRVDDDDARIGQVMLGRYQVRRVVADGGMGRVYEALDMAERRSVALKVLHSETARDAVAVERFKREFSVSQELPHQHIVEVLGFHPTADASYVLVMEFLYGEELRAALKREGVLPPARVVRMMSQLAIALDQAHARGFVHRDLKPDNLFLCQTSEGDIVKVLDFGSVKDTAENAKKLTVLGTTIGSPFYMAPEQAQGLETLDRRADVWALAAILYECTTGTVPFHGTNGPSILLSILTKEAPPPSEASRAQKHPVPPTLDAVMASAFRKNALMRTGSVGELANALGHAYGLQGDHGEWANANETELRQRISVELGRLMAARPAPQSRDVADRFFGEAESLGAEGASMPAAYAQGRPADVAFGESEAERIPMNRSWLLPVLLGGLLLAVGAVLLVVLAL
jgi:serine/threonine-protein kinase